MAAIEDGFYQPEMKVRMDALIAEKARLLERASSGELAEKVVTCSPELTSVESWSVLTPEETDDEEEQIY